MKTIRIKTPVFSIFIITAILIAVCLIMPEDFIIKYGQWFYAFQFFSVFLPLLKYKNNFLYYFSPSFMTFAYVNLTFAFGHFAVSRGLGFSLDFYNAFINYKSVSLITAYFLTCNFLVIIAIPFNKFKSITQEYVSEKSTPNKLFIVFLLLIFLLILSSLDINLDSYGGAGNFNYIFELAITIGIVLIISSSKNRFRFLIYLSIILLYLVMHFDSKREIFFVVLLIVFTEIVKNNISIRIKPKQIIISVLGLAFMIYVIIVASIMRGYGKYEIENPIDASAMVFNYVQSDFAVNAMVANFEFTYAYGNTSNAVDYVLNNEVNYLFGSTFFKVFFIPIPRSAFPSKPRSMVDIYTDKFDPQFRNIGGSYPIGIYAESLWNFSVFGLPFILIMYIIFNMFFLKLIVFIKKDRISVYSLFLMYLYITLIQFVRGAGIELWLLYAILALPTIFLVKILFILKVINSE